jgi:hypothetical protein
MRWSHWLCMQISEYLSVRRRNYGFRYPVHNFFSVHELRFSASNISNVDSIGKAHVKTNRWTMHVLFREIFSIFRPLVSFHKIRRYLTRRASLSLSLSLSLFFF